MNTPLGVMPVLGVVCQKVCLGNFSTDFFGRSAGLYTFEINGEHASIRWDLHDLNRMEYFDHRGESIVRGWHSIHVSHGDQPYTDKWWVSSLCIGYEHSFVYQVADFLDGLTLEYCPLVSDNAVLTSSTKLADELLRSRPRASGRPVFPRWDGCA